MRATLGLSLCLLLVLGTAIAGEDPPERLTPGQAADAVLEAIAAKDEASLRALAARNDPDPWLVADELCSRRRYGEAAAFSEAAPRRAVEKLPAYVASRRDVEPGEKARAALEEMNEALRVKAWARVIDLATAGTGPLDSVVRIRIAHGRAIASGSLGQREEAVQSTVQVARAARALGWMHKAAALLYGAGRSAARAMAHSPDRDRLYRLGLEVLHEARDIFAEIDEPNRVAEVEWGIGIAHDAAGKHPEALESFHRALAAYRQVDDRQGIAYVLNSIAVVHIAQGKDEEALPYLEDSLRRRRELGEKRATVRVLKTLGSLHARGGDPERALTRLQEALALAREVGDGTLAADALFWIGSVHERQGDHDEALRVLEQALALSQEAHAAQLEFHSLMELGKVHRALRHLEEALAYFDRALARGEAYRSPALVQTALSFRGAVLRDMGRPREAEAAFRRQREVFLAIPDEVAAGVALVGIGLAQLDYDAYGAAIESLQQALGVIEAHPGLGNAADCLNGIGSAYSGLGDYPRAIEFLTRALEAHEARGRKGPRGDVLVNLGLVHSYMGNFQKALSFHRRALDADTARGDEAGAAGARVNIGLVHQFLGEYATALSIYEQALGDAERLEDPFLAAHVLNNLGAIYADLGDPAKALSCYERSRTLSEKVESPAMAATALDNLGSALERLGRRDEALEAYRRALATHRALENELGVARSLNNIGLVHRQRGNYEEALKHFQAAHATARKSGDARGVTLTLLNIARTHHLMGEVGLARKEFEAGRRGARRLRSAPLLVDALTDLATFHIDEGSPARALMAAQRALDEIETLWQGLGEAEGALARQRHSRLFAQGAWAAVLEDDPAEAFHFLESGRAGAFLDGLDKREILRWKAESLPAEIRADDARAHAAQRVARAGYDRAVRDGRLVEIRRARAALDDATAHVRDVGSRIQRELKAQANLVHAFYPRAELLGDVQSALAHDQALVLYGLLREEAVALVLRQESERMVKLGPVADVTAACEALDLGDASVDPSKAIARLGALLVGPLEIESDVKQVLVSPEGPLCYLPFALLFEQTVAMTPSGSAHVLLLDEQREPGEGVLALGDPDYAGVSEGAREIYYRGRRLDPLPATRAEIQAVGTTALRGPKASEPSLRTALTQAERWKSVHFAGHGLIDGERPMLSSLALSASGDEDGFLTALEVLRMRIPADLAVLSACETATGKIVGGEGIVGLTRAFMFAGTPRVICSLWKVDDAATQALMVRFYELWNPKDGSTGLGCAAALEKAQAHVRAHPDHPEWKHPHYWAAWTLWGLPD